MESPRNHKKKKQQQQAVGSYYLPEQIFSEILIRIPANCLTRLKAICKSWGSLISHPTFQKSQLNQSRQPRHQMIILTTFSKASKHQFSRLFRHRLRYLIVNQPSGYHEPDATILSVDMQHKINEVRVDNIMIGHPRLTFSVKASCDGLLLLCDQYQRLFLHNPVNATYKQLPKLKDDRNMAFHEVYDYIRSYDWTLFYDPSAGKYKVYLFYFHNIRDSCLVFLTVGDARWRARHYHYLLKPVSPLVFLNNKLHWLTFMPSHPKGCFIISMDLVETKFTKTQVPIEQNGHRHLLLEVKGSLCLTSFTTDQLDIRVLEDFTSGQWTHQYSTSLRSLSNLPACLESFLSDDVCLVVTRDLNGCDFSARVKIFIHDQDQLICYDLKHQESSIVGPLSKDQQLRECYQLNSSTFLQV